MVMKKEEINNVLDIIESKENLADTIRDTDDRGKTLDFLYENGYISEPNVQRGGIGNKYKIASAKYSEVLRRP